MSQNEGDSKETTPEKVQTFDLRTTAPGVATCLKLETLNDIFEKTDAEIIEYLKRGALPITSLMYARSWGEITACFTACLITVQVEYIGVWLLLHFRPDDRVKFLRCVGISLTNKDSFPTFYHLHRWVKEHHPELPKLFRERTFTKHMTLDVTSLLEMTETQRRRILGMFGLEFDEVMRQKSLCDLIILLHERGIKYTVSRIELWEYLKYGPDHIEESAKKFMNEVCAVFISRRYHAKTVGDFCKLLDGFHATCDCKMYEPHFFQYEMDQRMRSITQYIKDPQRNMRSYVSLFWLSMQKSAYWKPKQSGLSLTNDGTIKEKNFGALDMLLVASSQFRLTLLRKVEIQWTVLLRITTFDRFKKYLEYRSIQCQAPSTYLKTFWQLLDRKIPVDMEPKISTQCVGKFLETFGNNNLRILTNFPSTLSPAAVDSRLHEITDVICEVNKTVQGTIIDKRLYDDVFDSMKEFANRNKPKRAAKTEDQSAAKQSKEKTEPSKITGKSSETEHTSQTSKKSSETEHTSQTSKKSSETEHSSQTSKKSPKSQKRSKKGSKKALSSKQTNTTPTSSTNKENEETSGTKTKDTSSKQPDGVGDGTANIDTKWRESEIPSGPMKNDQGIDCFINSLFKAFIHCEEFAALVVEETPCKGSIDDPKCIGCQFIIKSRHSLTGFNLDPQTAFRPVMMKGKASMRSLVEREEQQDVHEFMISLLKECKRSKLHQIFTFQEVIHEVCAAGHGQKADAKPSTCFLLYFKTQDPEVRVSMQKLLDHNFAKQPVEVSLNCGCQISHHSRRIEQAPQVLSFLLVRSVRGGRLNTPVENTFSLQVAGYNYSLHAAIMHDSMEADWGHYYTYVRVEDDWWKMNDTEINRASLEDFQQDERLTYLLFYRRMEPLPPRRVPKTEFCDEDKIQSVKAQFSKKATKPRAIREFDSQLSLPELEKFYNVGLCVTAFDGVVDSLLQKIIASRLVKDQHDNENDLMNFFQLEQKEKVQDLIQLLEMTKYISHLADSSPVKSLQEATRRFHAWTNRTELAHTLEDSRNIIKTTLTNIFDRIKELYTKNSTYKWPERWEANFQLKKCDANQMKAGFLLCMSDENIVSALRLRIIEEIIERQQYPASKLGQFICNLYGEDSLMVSLSEKCREYRNMVVHAVDGSTFNTDEQRDSFIKAFEDFTNKFPLEECFPLQVKSVDEMKQEQLLPLASFRFFSNIVEEYQQLNHKCDENKRQCRDMRAECQRLFSRLEECCRQVKILVQEIEGTSSRL